MKRFKTLWIVTSLVLTISLTACQNNKDSGNTKTDKKPNIIYILADDLGYGDLGCFGQTEIKTPNLDNMAEAGMRFTQHYAGSTVCAPSRCVLMTGLHTGHAKIRANARLPLNEEDVTIAKLLKEAGYKTGLIGKWGLGELNTTGHPNKQGFDYFFGYLSQLRAHNYYPDYLWRNTEKVALDNEVVFVQEGRLKGRGSAAVEQNVYSHDLFTKKALNFLEESADSSFFLYLAYTIPHANNEHWLIDKHGMEVPDYGQYANKDWPEAQIGLAAMISRMDRDIGTLKKKLEDLGIDKNTLIIFSSDNGPHKEGDNDPRFFNSSGGLRGHKRDLYEGGIREPMIAYWPGTIQPGQTSDHISAFWDFLPTACDVAGIEVPLNIDGISFLPELLGKDQPEHKAMYWEFISQGGKQAVRKGKWKLVKLDVLDSDKTRVELYNLENDRAEQEDVSESYPEVLAEMKKLLETERTESEHFPLYVSK
ncbi:MAG: arylsulfatase [Draconibacterium sp.]|nr:arylsulfatase [Draconibacterium sp.]